MRARRDENDALARQVALYRAAGGAPAEHLDMLLSFAPECGSTGCDATVELPLDRYGRESVRAH